MPETFTPAEANSALDEVRPVAERLVALRERVRELCWHVGEPAVAFWHETGEGYAGRKPIDWRE